MSLLCAMDDYFISVPFNSAALDSALRSDDPEAFQSFLNTEFDEDLFDFNDDYDGKGSVLMRIIENEAVNILGYVIKKKLLFPFHINKKVKDDELYPLSYAAYLGYYKIVELLLGAGADVNTVDYYSGQTALHKAVMLDKDATPSDFVLRLLNYGADPNIQDRDGKTPLHVAVKNDDYGSVFYLLRHEANLNTQDAQGWTPLHIAVIQNYYELAKYLLEKGADSTIKDNQGGLPSSYIDADNLEMRRLFFPQQELEDKHEVITYRESKLEGKPVQNQELQQGNRAESKACIIC